jgi:Cu(I)/Ag(I) efflux system membrane fusion protein
MKAHRKIPLSLLLAISATACSRNQPPLHEPVEKLGTDTVRIYKDALENLKMESAHIAPFPELLSLMGKVGVTEDRTTVVPARVAGRTESIFFASGEYVTTGKVLMSLFSPDYVAAKEEYLQAAHQANEHPSALSHADPSDFANLALLARKKLETMGLSKEDIQGLREDTSKDALLTIRAPRSGVIMTKGAALGNLVNVGDTLFVIGDLSKVWFSGDLYPEDLPKVHKGQEVFINVVGVEKPIFGKVFFISPLVDPNTRSIKIRALMDNPGNSLKAEEYVQGNIILTKKDALLVPTTAIVRTPEGLVTYKRVTPNTAETNVASLDFKKVPVVVGAEQSGRSAISSGLSDGDIIVSDGAWLLDAALNSAQH